MRSTGITLQPDRPTPTTRDLVIASLLALPAEVLGRLDASPHVMVTPVVTETTCGVCAHPTGAHGCTTCSAGQRRRNR